MENYKSKALIVLLALIFSTSAHSQWSDESTDSLDYFQLKPSSAPSSLMIALHGCTQSATDFKDLISWEKAATDQNMMVILPDSPAPYPSCWDYFGPDHTENNRHNSLLIELTEKILTENPTIDTSKVMISGLSSGAGQAMVLGCLRPDLFPGVAVVGGPALGTTYSELANPRVNAQQTTHLCRRLAGERTEGFRKQKLIVLLDRADFIVSPKHSEITWESMKALYGLSEEVAMPWNEWVTGTNTEGDGLVLLSDDGSAKAAILFNDGLGHAWAAGNGEGPTLKYINPKSIDFSQFMPQLFLSKLTFN